MKSAWYAQLWRGKNAIVWLQRRLIRPGRRTKKIARELKINLPNLQLILPDGQLLAKICHANPGASVAEVTQSISHSGTFHSFWTTAGTPTWANPTCQNDSNRKHGHVFSSCGWLPLCVCWSGMIWCWYDVDIWVEYGRNRPTKVVTFMSCLYPFLAAHAVESSPFASEQSVGFPLVIPSI